MAATRKRFRWRKWNNLLHRDIGYLCVGLTLVYAISGVAVNHRADWNPNYRVTYDSVQLSLDANLTPGSPEFVEHVLDQLDVFESARGTFRRSPEELDIFLDDAVVEVDLLDQKATFESVRSRPVLRETNFLHLNEPKKLWTWMADIYALALAFLAISGMFVLKGKKGITGRGAWLTAVGIVIPVLFLLFYF